MAVPRVQHNFAVVAVVEADSHRKLVYLQRTPPENHIPIVEGRRNTGDGQVAVEVSQVGVGLLVLHSEPDLMQVLSIGVGPYVPFGRIRDCFYFETGLPVEIFSLYVYDWGGLVVGEEEDVAGKVLVCLNFDEIPDPDLLPLFGFYS